MAGTSSGKLREAVDKPLGRIGRRALLTGAGAGGVAAIAVRGLASPPAEDAPTENGRDPVYRETEHIRQFYARSRF